MFRSNFKPWQRGQMCLLALVLTGILMILVLAQFQFIRLSLKATHAHGLFPNRNTVLRDAVHEVKIQTTASAGDFDLLGNRLAFTREEDSQTFLTTEKIEVRFPERPHWPKPSGLWVIGQDWSIFVVDQRQE